MACRGSGVQIPSAPLRSKRKHGRMAVLSFGFPAMPGRIFPRTPCGRPGSRSHVRPDGPQCGLRPRPQLGLIAGDAGKDLSEDALRASGFTVALAVPLRSFGTRFSVRLAVRFANCGRACGQRARLGSTACRQAGRIFPRTPFPPGTSQTQPVRPTCHRSRRSPGRICDPATPLRPSLRATAGERTAGVCTPRTGHRPRASWCRGQ